MKFSEFLNEGKSDLEEYKSALHTIKIDLSEGVKDGNIWIDISGEFYEEQFEDGYSDYKQGWADLLKLISPTASKELAVKNVSVNEENETVDFGGFDSNKEEIEKIIKELKKNIEVEIDKKSKEFLK